MNQRMELKQVQMIRLQPIQRLVNLLTQARGGLRVSPNHKIHATAPSSDPADLCDAARQLMLNLGG